MNTLLVFHITNPRLRLFVISFLLLFLELALIRFIPAQIRYVGYFSNIILLASFVGISLGTLFGKSIKVSFSVFPLVLMFFELFISLFHYDLVVSSDQVIYFNAGFHSLASEPVFLMPVIFFAVVFVFFLPAKLLGELFNQFPPLSAYSIDILGSIAGIICFSLLSFSGTGPFIWFVIVLFLALLLIDVPKKQFWHNKINIGVVVFLIINFTISLAILSPIFNNSRYKISWSPYYEIKLNSSIITPPGSKKINLLSINVNNIAFQQIVHPNAVYAEPFYQYPYKVFPGKVFKNVLVIGAGTGNDVSKALLQGANKVVAVEIDPMIANLGRTYHPLHPYDSPKVHLVIEDGRSYIATTKEKFDLIIYALTDSLTLTSAASNLRLESYLFTKESFKNTKQRLNPGGIVVLYNYYRSPWIVDKLALLLQQTFHHPPYVTSLASSLGPAAVLIQGEKMNALPQGQKLHIPADMPVPTDDWPFLYLKQKSIPVFYLSFLSVITVILVVMVFLLKRKTKIFFHSGFFFLGAAFMLLETKNVVEFSLLFGSTWITNAFVFTGLLVLVLFAIWVANYFSRINFYLLYVLLFVCIAMNYFFPQQQLLQLPYLERLVAAVLLNFSPVFVANVIFSLLFKQTKTSSDSYGANIAGAFAGGLFEYTSLLWGYKNLTLFIVLFYALSLYTTFRSFKK